MEVNTSCWSCTGHEGWTRYHAYDRVCELCRLMQYQCGADRDCNEKLPKLLRGSGALVGAQLHVVSQFGAVPPGSILSRCHNRT